MDFIRKPDIILLLLGFLVFYFAFGLKEVSESQMPENARGGVPWFVSKVVMLGVIIRGRALFFSFFPA